MTKREHYDKRIKCASQEYQAAVVASRLLDERLKADPSFLDPAGLRKRDADALTSNLENTYLIRLYSEFEAGLRDVWWNAWGRTTEPPTRDLLDAAAARRKVSQDLLDYAHRVREFRNGLVHHSRSGNEPVTIIKAYEVLSNFFSRLPYDWK